LDNLARALASRRRPGEAVATENTDEIRRQLDASSLGLVAAARSMLTDGDDCLLVVADQFEEIFRFSQIAQRRDAAEQAAACVDLLVNASLQDDVPVYVVMTMRSDYLGDCAHFTGFPEALNDSQFLVPKMTRAQVRAAIESPIAVQGGRISPRLVQRLLHDVEHMSAVGEGATRSVDQQYQDQLPLLQHALMRLWEVSRADRERGEPIDLAHYDRPPVETIRHALDRHAEEVYKALPSDDHREVARLVFQRLTDRDAENREVRRPTPLAELTSVALRRSTGRTTPGEATMVTDVISAFSAEGRAFVVVNAQQDVDISHESFIRQWERLRGWVDEENRSGRIYAKLADTAARWSRGEASLYRGPELAEARRWWEQETPTEAWANRYGSGFELAEAFLSKSTRARRLSRGLMFGYIALLVIAAVAVVFFMNASRRDAIRAEEQARRAEEAALEARNAAVARNEAIASAEEVRKASQSLEARAAILEGQIKAQGGTTGDSVEVQKLRAEADALRRQAQASEAQARNIQVLTPTELSELDRLRKQEGELDRLRRQEAAWKGTEADLRRQLAAAQKPQTDPASTATLPGGDRTDLERLRKAEASWEQERTQLQQQVATARDQAAIRTVLDAFGNAYSAKDLATLTKIYPSIEAKSYGAAFTSFAALDWRYLSTDISIKGDEATAVARVRIARTPLERRSAPPVEETTRRFTLRRSPQGWTLVALRID
jgi:hypothetical protein